MRLGPLVVAVVALFVVVGCGKSSPPIGQEGFLLVEQCTCMSTGVTVYADPNYYVGDGAPEVCDAGLHNPDAGNEGPQCPDGQVCVPNCENTDNQDNCGHSEPPSTGGCWITGGGLVADAQSTDTFGGNGMPMKSGDVRGEWEHQIHGFKHKAHGQVRYLVCRHVDEPGPGQPSGPDHTFNINQVYFGGPARWNDGSGWSNGYWFDIMAEDHGEPGNTDFYHYTIRQMTSANQSGAVLYDISGVLVGGNIQIHPPNDGHPYSGGTLPSWVQLQP
jgi:hypothetical protein